MFPDEPLLIDCDSCTVRGDACGECVVSAILGDVPDNLAPSEQVAIEVLARHGLVPALRLVTEQRAG